MKEKQSQTETNQTIRTNYNFSMAMFFVSALLVTAILLLFIFTMQRIPSTGEYVLYAFLGLIAVAFLCLGIFNLQFATLSADGIKFKWLFGTFTHVKWDDIKKIELRKLSTLHSRGNARTSKTWIVITTNPEDPKYYGGANWKIGPWTIIATPKNIAAVENWAKTNAPHNSTWENKSKTP